ncbi:hypothetical protein DYB31_009571 [Aphanomyces astaci]|uniref:Vacuolar protein 8 n=1 Tax=Aphanomyces astaci TaxID=112090 RepID=A0A397EA65_APHAT|nr:hypothetical protein DYB31_009571 [Aphanomyces astaci]
MRHRNPRVIVWTKWVARLSSEATDALQETKLEFDDVVACSSSSMNLTADATTHERCHSHLDRLHVLQETDYWVSSSAIPVSINEVNVLSIGDTSGALAILIELSCASSQEVPLAVREGALGSVAALAMHSRNIHLMGRVPGFLQTLLGLCEDDAPSRTMQVHALHSLTNLSFQNRVHHQLIYSMNGMLVLLRVLRTSKDVDVVDLALSAVANLTESHVDMIDQVLLEGGLAQLLTLSIASYLCDAVEDGKMDTIQGNIALCVVHILHASPETVLRLWVADSSQQDANQSTSSVAHPGSYLNLCLSLVVSGTVAVQSAAIMVLGVVAQHDIVRGQLGDAGAVELLAPLLTHSLQYDDEGNTNQMALVEQTAWTLLQLSWNRDNQTRMSQYSHTFLTICQLRLPKWTLVQQHVFQLVGNIVFYHPENRHMMLEDNQWLALLLETCGRQDVSWRVDCVRAICALSYENAFASSCDHIPVIVAVLQSTTESDLVLHGLQWLSNLLVHDGQKSRFVHCPLATETVVTLCGSENKTVRHHAQVALDLVADIRLPHKRTREWS